MINVLVTGAGGGVGQGIIKSLRMIKDLPIKIVAADMSEMATGLYSGDEACLVEGCSSPSYLDSLAAVFKKFEIDFYFPGTDVELGFCAKNKAHIKNVYGVETVISSLETIEIADDKYKTFEFLKKNGFYYPETNYLSEIDSISLEYPLIVKPAVGCRSIGVYKVASYDELEKHLHTPEGIIVQECVGTDDDEYTCTLVKVNDQISPVLALKRVLRSGDTFRAIPVKSEVIESYVQSVSNHLDIEGGCNFQLRLDSRGKPKIFEINSRFSGTTPFCSQLGFNPVEFYLKAKMGHKYNPIVNYDSVVLRYWSEVVVENEQLRDLAATKFLTPKKVKQLKMFDGEDL